MNIFNKPVTLHLAPYYNYYLEKVIHFRRATLLPVDTPADELNFAVHGTLMYEERTELDDAFKKFRQLSALGFTEYQQIRDTAPTVVTREAAQDIADALADMIFIYLGYVADHGADIIPANWVMDGIQKTATNYNIDLLRAFNLVYDSNMSKLCTTGEFDVTIAKYAKEGIEVEFREIPAEPGRYAVYCVHDPAGNLPKGKLLKPVGYFKPQWIEDTSWYIGE